MESDDLSGYKKIDKIIISDEFDYLPSHPLNYQNMEYAKEKVGKNLDSYIKRYNEDPSKPFIIKKVKDFLLIEKRKDKLSNIEYDIYVSQDSFKKRSNRTSSSKD